MCGTEEQPVPLTHQGDWVRCIGPSEGLGGKDLYCDGPSVMGTSRSAGRQDRARKGKSRGVSGRLANQTVVWCHSASLGASLVWRSGVER